MKLTDLKRQPKEANRVIGLDLNSSKMAFSIFDDKRLIKYGEVEFPGKTLFQRLNSANKIISILRDELQADKIVFESAIYVNNRKTVISLAYMYGAVVSTLAEPEVEIGELGPTEWGKAIGNNGISQKERAAFKRANPGKTKGWYDQQFREQRKQITKNWVQDTFGIDTSNLSDDVCDAIAVGAVAAGAIPKI